MIGPAIDDTDFKTGETGVIADTDIELSKDSGNFAAKNDTTNSVSKGDGFHLVELDATDTNTLGILKLRVSISGVLIFWEDYIVLPQQVYDSLYAGSDKLQVDAVEWVGDTIPSSLVTGVPDVNIDRIKTLQSNATRLADFLVSGYDDVTNQVNGVKLVDVTTLNTDMLTAAAVNAEVDTALSDIGLDHLLSTSVIGADVADNSIFAYLVSNGATADWDDFINTSMSLHQLALNISTVNTLVTGQGLGAHATAASIAALNDVSTGDLAAAISSGFNFDSAGNVGADLAAILDTDLGESTAGNLANNFDTFYDNADALTTKVVDDVGGGSGGWSVAEQNQIRHRLNIDGTQAAPTAGGAAKMAGTDADLTLKSVVVSNSGGSAVKYESTGANGVGFEIIGNGTGSGATITSGAGASAHGLYVKSLATNGNGAVFQGIGTGAGGLFWGGGTSGDGIEALGNGTGDGFSAISGFGATGSGIRAEAKSTNGHGLELIKTGTGIDLKASDHGDGSWETATGFATVGALADLDAAVEAIGVNVDSILVDTTAGGAGPWTTGAGGGLNDDSFTYDWNTDITDSDPGTGEIKIDNATYGSATFIYISKVNKLGTVMNDRIESLRENDTITIGAEGDGTKFIRFTMSGDITGAVGYYKIPVNSIEDSGTLIAADDVLFSLTPLHPAKALLNLYLDQLIAAPYNSAAPDGASDALLNEMTENDGGLTRFTQNALEQAPIATGFSTHTAADVWSVGTRELTGIGSSGIADATTLNTVDGKVDGIKAVTDNMVIKKNTAIANYYFVMFDSLGNPKTGLAGTIVAEVTGDGDITPNAIAGTIVEIGVLGLYKIVIAQADVNYDELTFIFSDPLADTTFNFIKTVP